MVANLNMAFLALLACSSAITGRSNTFTSCVDGLVTKGSATWVADNALEGEFANTSTLAGTTYRGIHVTESPGSNVRCNDMLNFGWGVAWAGTSFGSTMYHNQVHNAYDGVVLEVSGRIGQQGTATSPSDNLWQGGFGRSYTFALNSIGPNSLFYARANIGNPNVVYRPIGPLQSQTQGGIPFQFPLAGAVGPVTQASCIEQIVVGGGSGIPGGGPKADIHKVASDTTNAPVFPDEIRWKSKAWAYTTVYRDGSLMVGDTIITGFYNSYDTTSLALVAKAYESVRDTDWVGAQVQIGTVLPSNHLEYNLKKEVEIRAGNEIDRRLPAQLEKIILSGIAMECPEVGGPAVWNARARLALLGEMIWTGDTCLYSPGHARQAENTYASHSQTVGQLLVYPNPATTEVTFVWKGLELNEPIAVRIFDNLGNQISTAHLGEKTKIGLLDVRGFAAGTYYYVAFGPNLEVFTGKIVLVP